VIEAKGVGANVANLTKHDLRKQILAARRAVGADVRAAEVDSLQTHLALLTAGAETICAYIPVGSEPGSPHLLDALTGIRVLVPVARDGEPMRWAQYRPGELVDAPFGLREPAPPWLPPETIAQETEVLVPALAVDRQGVRVGRGAG
jgi:5-formyltetrahydrofolate cyclo-ligase